MVSARDSPDPVMHWIALLDEAEYLIASAPCAPGGLLPVEPALAALVAYEHAMTPAQRYQARETIWRRDRPAEPLPDSLGWGTACTCRACRLARRVPHSPERETVYQAQLRTLAQQKQRQLRKER